MIDCSLNLKTGTIDRRSSTWSIFLQFFPIVIFHLIENTTNKFFFRHSNTTIKNSTMNTLEILLFLCVRLSIMCLNTNGKLMLEQYYNMVKLNLTQWLPMTRFKLLHARAQADVLQMAKLLRQRTTNILQPSQIYAIDELLVGFRSRKSKLVVKIPRKPNSVGYLIYIMSTVSRIYNLPYAIDCFPVVKDIHTKFDFQMNGFVDCLLASYPSLKNRVHLVTDSAFGTYTIIQTLKLNGIFMTSSMKFK